MKIAIDCRPLQNRYATRGIGTVARNLLAHLVQSRCSASLILCGNSVVQPMRCGEYRMLRRPAGHDGFWEQAKWPFDLMGMKAGILHSTVSLGLLREIGLPLACPAKRIATVHDCTPLRMPELAPHTRMKSFRIQKIAVRHSARVIVPSAFVKNDCISLLKVNEHKVIVMPWAVDEAIAKAFDKRAPSVTGTAAPFVLAMGEDANKNMATVIKVFERLAAKGFPGTLRIIGTQENQTARVRQLLADLPAIRERILFTGVISPEQVTENYATSSLFLFPSLYEGFGLPVLEAMYCGSPVITSNTSSLPEAGGDAAICRDPLDVDALAEAAERVLHDNDYRKTMVEKGNRHARSRSWNEAAESVVGMYEELGWENT
jgi:glycosyltransferase involved in cell wall biosynthesis